MITTATVAPAVCLLVSLVAVSLWLAERRRSRRSKAEQIREDLRTQEAINAAKLVAKRSGLRAEVLQRWIGSTLFRLVLIRGRSESDADLMHRTACDFIVSVCNVWPGPFLLGVELDRADGGVARAGSVPLDSEWSATEVAA